MASKTKSKKRTANKTIKKQIKSISKRLKKTVSREAKDKKKVAKELEKLKTDLKKLKGKRTKKQLNEYNLFMRRQLNDGKSFGQAVNLWKKLRKVETGKIPTKTRIKTVVKKIRVKAKPKIRTRTVVKTRTIIRKAKPKISYKTRVVEKPVIKTVHAPVIDLDWMKTFASQIATQTVSNLEKSRGMPAATIVSHVEKSGAWMESAGNDLPTEEMAYRMVKMYFEELARTGFKRQMSLDDLVDAFIYSWYRVEKRVGGKEQRIHKEEIAYRLVNLFYIELARLGQKRSLNLDEVLDSYFYVLDRLGKDNSELIKQMEAVKSEQTTTVVTEKKTETVAVPVQTTTTTTTVSNPPSQ